VPTQVRITPVKGKAVLISGHDMTNLEELLKQTEGKVGNGPAACCCARTAQLHSILKLLLSVCKFHSSA
jgi:hydroxylamine reductase (hybrid-cluster protein)